MWDPAADTGPDDPVMWDPDSDSGEDDIDFDKWGKYKPERDPSPDKRWFYSKVVLGGSPAFEYSAVDFIRRREIGERMQTLRPWDLADCCVQKRCREIGILQVRRMYKCYLDLKVEWAANLAYCWWKLREVQEEEIERGARAMVQEYENMYEV